MSSQARSTKHPIFRLKGKQVEEVVLDSGKRLSVMFSGGTALVIGISAGKLTTEIIQDVAQTSNAQETPTKRQLEYLLFIAKYIRRYGRAPAESDIERHFLVSAPSVNQMMQMLERRRFISRQPGVPRSARICIDLGPLGAN